MPAGRALDIGCGTGTNSLYLARHGWQVTGIDFAAPAIGRAQRKAQRAGLTAETVRFVRGDVTRLGDYALGRGYSLLFDLGCLHGIPAERHGDYAAGLRRLAAPGALYLLYAFGPRMLRGRAVGLTGDEVETLFGEAFVVERVVEGSDRTRGSIPSAWYWLRRRM